MLKDKINNKEHEFLFENGLNIFVKYVFNNKTNLSYKEKELINFIKNKFYEYSKSEYVDVEHILFYNIFYHALENNFVIIFRFTNIFDESTHLWKLHKWRIFVDSLDIELKEIIYLIKDKKDRNILRKTIKVKDRIIFYLKNYYKYCSTILETINKIEKCDFILMLKRKNISGVNLDEIDLFKDIRNITVHGFSVKDIKLYYHLDKFYPLYFEKFRKDEKFELLISMMLLINFTIFLRYIESKKSKKYL